MPKLFSAKQARQLALKHNTIDRDIVLKRIEALAKQGWLAVGVNNETIWDSRTIVLNNTDIKFFQKLGYKVVSDPIKHTTEISW